MVGVSNRARAGAMLCYCDWRCPKRLCSRPSLVVWRRSLRACSAIHVWPLPPQRPWRSALPTSAWRSVSLLKLIEQSPAELRAALADEALAGDLALCVGGSEVIAQGLGTMGPRWLEFFLAARGASADSIVSAIRFAAGPSADRQEAAGRLGEFKRRLFLQIAIADLVGRLDVAATMRAMSRLADECIAAALECARLIVGPRAPAPAAFCVLGMGKLGAQELNLSSDIDLIYVFDGPDDNAEAVARLGETLTELLSGQCFRVDMRLRPGGRNAPLVTPV